MLVLSLAYLTALIRHVYRQHPIEACGVLAAPVGTRSVAGLFEMTNAADSPVAYRFDPAQQLAVWTDMQQWGLRPVAIYHSHTTSSARLSRVDLAQACLPRTRQVVVSTQHPDRWVLRVWSIRCRHPFAEPVLLLSDGIARLHRELSGRPARP